MLADNHSRFSTLDGKAINFFLGSTFSEYTVLEHQNVVKVGPDAPLEQICVLSCGVTTGKFHTNKKKNTFDLPWYFQTKEEEEEAFNLS